MRRFYTNQIGKNNTLVLDSDENKHLLKVLRLRIGDDIEVVDGVGNLYFSKIENIVSQKAIISYKEKKYFDREKSPITAVIAVTKNSKRFEFFVEKATEIGVDEIIPICTKRSERVKLKMDRLSKIVISAGKQSNRLHFPILRDITNLEDLSKFNDFDQKFVAHCFGERYSIAELYDKNQSAIVMIGPEGDFTNEEMESLVSFGYKPITLGQNRLRVETAAIYAISVMSFLRNK